MPQAAPAAVGVGSTEPDRDRLRTELAEVLGGWDERWESVLTVAPKFLEVFHGLASVPHRRNQLGAKTRAFVGLALNSAVTHLHEPGIRRNIRAALDAGATESDIVEVLELTSALSIHGVNVGALTDAMVAKGMRTGPTPLTAAQEEIKETYTHTRGYWQSFLDEMLELDPELFGAYTEYSSLPWRGGSLEPKVKEFIYIAFDTSPTHLHLTGLRLHIENALGYGATPTEILEIMELASTMGAQTLTTAAPILLEELARRATGGAGHA